jgi:hypothetical protein
MENKKITDFIDKLFSYKGEDWVKFADNLWERLKMERDEIIKEWERGNEPDMKKKIEVELPEPPSSGGYASCPSGDTEYEEAMNEWHQKVNGIILKAVPKGYNLKSSEIKQTRTVRNFAVIEIEKR